MVDKFHLIDKIFSIIKERSERMSIVKVENVTKIYGKGAAEVRALDGVSFEIEEGDFVAIIGKSGSGKSTLMHILGGVDKPTAGHVLVGGKDILKLSRKELALYRRREVGLIYQFYNLVPILNVRENLLLPALLDKRKIDEKEVEELLEVLDLKNRVYHLPNELSGGQEQRVSIGRSLLQHPTLILADEPTGNLDTKSSSEIISLLSLANQKYKRTIIMITHDREMAKYARRILTLEDGKIIKDEVNHERSY